MDNCLVIKNEVAILNPKVSKALAQFEKELATLKAKEDELKARILEEMAKADLIKIDTPELTINYIAPTDVEDFNKKQFRTDHPDLYDEYVTFKQKAGYIRIKVKG